MASGSKDKTIKLWNAATGSLLNTITGHTGRIESLAFSPDGKTLATGGGGGDTSIRLWNVGALPVEKKTGKDATAAATQNTSVPEYFAPIEDQPGLPRVLLVGDSISVGYTLPVRELLKGRANVHRIPTNGGSTTKGLANVDQWLGDKKWDVIHFNWGIHDLRIQDGKALVGPEAYEKNLRAIVAKLKATGAKLIWASTTPITAWPLTNSTPPSRRASRNSRIRKTFTSSRRATLSSRSMWPRASRPRCRRRGDRLR